MWDFGGCGILWISIITWVIIENSLIDWLIDQFIYPSCTYSWITRAPVTILLIFISTKIVLPFSPGNYFNTAIYNRARAKRIPMVGFRGNGYYVWKKTFIWEILHDFSRLWLTGSKPERLRATSYGSPGKIMLNALFCINSRVLLR